MTSRESGVALYIDPPSQHFLDDRLFRVDGARLNGDNREAEYVYLRKSLAAASIEVHTADFLAVAPFDGTTRLYVSLGSLRHYPIALTRPDTKLSAFFALECPIVEPSLYRDLNRVQSRFERVFSWSDSDALQRFVGGPLRCQEFRFPQVFNSVHEELWSRAERAFLVMINANKLPRVYWQELYTERLRALEFFSRTNEIDLYGKGWDEPPNRVGRTWVPASVRRIERALLKRWQRWRPDPLLEAARRVYRGPAQSKAETLAGYTFAICFENMVLRGWITEKMFDCFYAGTVPVYWGAPDIEKYVPAECFVDMRGFADYRELRDFLRALSQRDIQRYKENARAFLASPMFRPHSKEAFAELFHGMIAEDAGVWVDVPPQAKGQAAARSASS